MLPMGTDLSIHDQQALDAIADWLNNRPRQTLNWRRPNQAFRDLMHGFAEQAAVRSQWLLREAIVHREMAKVTA